MKHHTKGTGTLCHKMQWCTAILQELQNSRGHEVKGKRKRGRPKKKWKTQVDKESKSVGLENKDALNQARWRVGVGEITVTVG